MAIHILSLTSIQPVEWEISFAFPIFSLFHLLAALVVIVVCLMVGLIMAHPPNTVKPRAATWNIMTCGISRLHKTFFVHSPFQRQKNYWRCYTWRCSHCCCCCCCLLACWVSDVYSEVHHELLVMEWMWDIGSCRPSSSLLVMLQFTLTSLGSRLFCVAMQIFTLRIIIFCLFFYYIFKLWWNIL